MDDRKQNTLLYNRDDRGSKMKLSKFSFRHSKLFPFANSQYLSKLKKISSDLKMNYNIHPDPLENDVLFLHNDHRALSIFTNPEKYNQPLNVKRGDRSLWNFLKENPLGERVKGIIQEAGLGGVLSCGYRYLDHTLITALVERWRPETHTFHLPVGEATITLQDINVLWGLPVEGVVVSGPETPLTEQQAINMCETLLGFTPERNDFIGKSLKSATIIRELEKPFSEVEATDEECVIRARSIIFYLIGCTILPNNANNRISLHRLRLLDDLRRCSSYSWGSAALACLYRNLCDATAPDAIALSGPAFILQLWAWERFPSIGPQIDVNFDHSVPLAARWQEQTLNFTVNPSHCLRTYRSQLQSLHRSHFKWTPYNDIIGKLPPICRSGMRSWMSTCPLIYWDIVEHHYPQRVMRQFGMVQQEPPPISIQPSEHKRLHKLNRQGKTGTNWLTAHQEYVSGWNNRDKTLINGEIITTRSVDADYMPWYNARIVVYVSDPREVTMPPPAFQDDGAIIQMMIVHHSNPIVVEDLGCLRGPLESESKQ